MTVDRPAPKRAYRKPKLQVIGSMQEITAIGNDPGGFPDGGTYPTDMGPLS